MEKDGPKTAKRTPKAPRSATANPTGASPSEPNGQDLSSFNSGPIDGLKLVRQMIRRCAEQAEQNKQGKAGVAELIRLLALEKELAEVNETIREIKVTWVEPTETV